MAERIFINDLTPITDIQDGAKILVDQNGYKKMFYEDFVTDIADTLKSEHGNGWNADLIGGVDVTVETAQQGDVLIFNSSSNEFENRRIDSNDIDWSSISVNEYKFLQVGSGGIVEQDFVSIPSLRIDNDTSSGYFLRVKSGNREIEAVPFDPNEFTINAQTLEGNTVSDLDGRYLRVANNLQDITDASVARSSLNVISETESDSRYLARTNNLSDISNPITAFNNIKQLSTPSYAGVIEIATSAEVQDGIRPDVAVVPSTLSDNYYNKSTSDGRFLNAANNLDDLNNSTAARQNLNVLSKTESDSRYIQKALNFSDITSLELSRQNLGVYDKTYIDTYTLNKLNNLSDVDNVGMARDNLDVYPKSTIDAIQSKILDKNNNLSDVPNKAAARNNLGVYSKAEVDSRTFGGFSVYGVTGSVGDHDTYQTSNGTYIYYLSELTTSPGGLPYNKIISAMIYIGADGDNNASFWLDYLLPDETQVRLFERTFSDDDNGAGHYTTVTVPVNYFQSPYMKFIVGSSGNVVRRKFKILSVTAFN